VSEGILIYAEINKSGYIAPVFFELAAKAQELLGLGVSGQGLGVRDEENEKLSSTIQPFNSSTLQPISALLIGAPGSAEKFKEGFEKCGFDKVYALEDERLNEYNTDLYAKAAVDVIKELDPAIVLIGATNQGRDLAPRIASSLHTGLTADCTDLEINEKGQLAATRPTFGGKLMATILCKTNPQMASVRPKVFKPLDYEAVKDTEFIYKKPDIDGVEKRVELLEFIKSAGNEVNALEYAQVVVAGGVGMKNAEGFKMLEELAAMLNGHVGATRAAVDIGLASHDKQIGQTGLTVSPKLYIACGISGAVQHVVGMSNSDKIIAINTDPNASIFETCDIGYVGDVFEVVPELIKSLK
jgi:electron transfer flavoprotein alpha subunit